MKRYYQKVGIKKVFASYAEGFKPPNDARVIDWEANYDSRSGEVWFELTVEEPAPAKKNEIVIEMPKRNGGAA